VEKPERRIGRPPGKKYAVVKSLRFDERDAGLLQRLADARRCSEAALVRLLVREEAARRGLE
jgi:hypothetical protein